MEMPGFTAEASIYQSARYYVMTPSVASVAPVRDGGLVSMSLLVPPCGSGALGDQGCYPDVDGSLISICPCGSPSDNCGPCFDFTYIGHDFGMLKVCRCVEPTSPPPPCCPVGKKCCGTCVPGMGCDDVCIGKKEQCP